MESKSVSFKSTDVEARTFYGHASTFDLDRVGDIITRGAFEKTLSERGARVKIMYNHKELIGKPMVMREDEKGLYVEGKISSTRRGDEILELLKDNVLDTMSITYSIPKGGAEYNEDGVRLIKQLDLYEFGPVDFAANEAAIITGIKSLTSREIERVLRDAGLSRSQAKAIASAGIRNLREAEEETDKKDQAREELSALLKAFKLT